MTKVEYRRHPVRNIDHFSENDGTVKFYGFVNAIILSTDGRRVLDFGAGRGAFWHDDASTYRRQLQDLRVHSSHVTACDIDPAVASHPCSHEQVVIHPNAALPFANDEFDVIVSDCTFEHISDPSAVAAELLRVLKPRGYICARTPNNFGYVRMLSALVPNRLHARVLGFVQPDRREADIFPTVYQLNSINNIRKHFQNCDVFHYRDSSDPAYYFGNTALYDMMSIFHKLAPRILATSLCAFIRKPA